MEDTIKTKNTTGLSDAKKIAKFAQEKQAKDVVILDLKKISTICNYYLICSGDSTTQVKAIYDQIIRKSKKEKIQVQHSEVDKTYNWILIDFSNVIVHIFTENAREFYNLEYLWRQAKKISLPKK
ncbi:MAG: ribosome silencing factor [Candidatus Omnitrophica bacterium]|nr:ribosome silencing factor [Candidatus Omnitrophota bacterium]MCF7893987.1 ribosome silencing factor [Candidatus Omnitrophota bacterium]